MPPSLCQCCNWRRRQESAFLLKSPRFPEEGFHDYDDVDPGAALAAAVKRPGGQAEALRHLKIIMSRSLDPLKFIDSDQLSHMLRVAKRFDEFVCLARPDFGKEGWCTGIAGESGLWFGYRIDDSKRTLHLVVVQDMHGIDPVRALAGYCSPKLFHQHSSDVQSCTVLAESADSALWNQVRQFSDDVVQVDLVNALDEHLGAIMIMIYPQPDSSPEFPAASIPGPCRKLRSRSNKQCITLTPLPGGVRMHVAAVTDLGDKKTRLEVERSSVDGMARLLRPFVGVWPKQFETFLRERQADLIHEEAFSPHAPFYAVCRAYLTGVAGSRKSSLHQWGFMFDKNAGK